MPFIETDAVEIQAPVSSAFQEILTPEALAFVSTLHLEFNGRRQSLLQNRQVVQSDLNAGKWPAFLPETQAIRQDGSWAVATPPGDLQKRHVEITGPVERKMMINALNSGADVFMADFEDAHSPTWENILQGQLNLRDAVNRTIIFTNPDGKRYALKENTAALMVRPRGWHLPEKHLLIDGQPVSASLFDFGLYFFSQCCTVAKQRLRSLFLSAKTRKPSGGTAVERRFLYSRGFAGGPTRHHQSHRAHREYSGGF